MPEIGRTAHLHMEGSRESSRHLPGGEKWIFPAGHFGYAPTLPWHGLDYGER